MVGVSVMVRVRVGTRVRVAVRVLVGVRVMVGLGPGVDVSGTQGVMVIVALGSGVNVSVGGGVRVAGSGVGDNVAVGVGGIISSRVEISVGVGPPRRGSAHPLSATPAKARAMNARENAFMALFFVQLLGSVERCQRFIKRYRP